MNSRRNNAFSCMFFLPKSSTVFRQLIHGFILNSLRLSAFFLNAGSYAPVLPPEGVFSALIADCAE